jgi:hypothetical protein
MLQVQPLPDDRFRFRIENDQGDKVICEVSGSEPGPTHSAAEKERVALERSLHLIRTLSKALRERLFASP